MNPKRNLQASWLAMIGVQTVGSIDGAHKMPAPKQYAAISVLWGILLLAAETRFARQAAQFAWLCLLAGIVLGPFGKRLVDFFELVAKYFAIPKREGEGGSAQTSGTADTYEPEEVVYA